MLSWNHAGKERIALKLQYGLLHIQIYDIKIIILIVANTYIELAVCQLVFLAILIH